MSKAAEAKAAEKRFLSKCLGCVPTTEVTVRTDSRQIILRQKHNSPRCPDCRIFCLWRVQDCDSRKSVNHLTDCLGFKPGCPGPGHITFLLTSQSTHYWCSQQSTLTDRGECKNKVCVVILSRALYIYIYIKCDHSDYHNIDTIDNVFTLVVLL